MRKKPRRNLGSALGAVLLSSSWLLIGPEAEAAGPPLRIQVGEFAPDTSFQFSGPTDTVDLVFSAVRGADYFVGFGTYTQIGVTLSDAGGHVLKRFAPGPSGEDVGETGAEFHPVRSGDYRLHVSVDASLAPFYPVHASAWVYPDCRGGPATKCTISVGRTKAGTFAGSNDDDSFKIKARAGKPYTATLHVDFPVDTLQLVDAGQHVLLQQDTGRGPYRRGFATLRFVLSKAGGPFFLKGVPHDYSHAGRGHYSLGLVAQ